MTAPTLMGFIEQLKKQHPQAEHIELTPELHEQLCDELFQKEGRPSRVYCVQGLRVIVSPPMEATT